MRRGLRAWLEVRGQSDLPAIKASQVALGALAKPAHPVTLDSRASMDCQASRETKVCIVCAIQLDFLMKSIETALKFVSCHCSDLSLHLIKT